jgi:2-methylcitrate dehydratase PrpD
MSRFVLEGREDPISPLCRMVVDIGYKDLPGNAIKVAKRSILDTLAVTIGGSALEGIPEIVALVKDRGGKPESIIPVYGGAVPAPEAALAIGPMSRAMDLGDFHEEAGHCSEYIIPALLAATGLKPKVNGKDFITALIVGQEILIRVGKAFNYKKAPSMGRGSAHFIFGTVAAVGKLLHLSLDELTNAEGMASLMTQPHSLAISSAIQDATLMTRFHHGFICQDAINVCMLAMIGITGPCLEVLAPPVGFLGFAKWETDPDALLSGLGEKWEMENIMMKHYPVMIYSQTPIEGILDQMKKHVFKAKDIAKIVIDESPFSEAIARKTPPWDPRTPHDCQFCTPYTVATAAYDGNVSLDSYTPQAMARQDVRDLMARISGREDPHLRQRAVRIHTTLVNGASYSREYIYSKGHPKNPFTDQELVERLKECSAYSAYKLTDAAIDSLIDSVMNLEKVDDVVSALLLPLVPK